MHNNRGLIKWVIGNSHITGECLLPHLCFVAFSTVCLVSFSTTSSSLEQRTARFTVVGGLQVLGRHDQSSSAWRRCFFPSFLYPGSVQGRDCLLPGFKFPRSGFFSQLNKLPREAVSKPIFSLIVSCAWQLCIN